MPRVQALLFGSFLVAAAAAVEPGFSPTTGTAGTPVVLTGHGFTPVRKPRVEFVPAPPPEQGGGSQKARVLSFDAAGITVETPRIAPGAYTIRVTPKGKEVAGPVDLAGTFTNIAPVVQSVDQASYVPGELCVLTGVFGSKKGGKVFLGTRKVRVEVWTPTSIQFYVPELPEGEHFIQVRNRTGPSQATHSVVIDEGGGDPDPVPAVTVSTNLLTIQHPQNCQQFFQITNTGDPGSQMSYTVADDGALGGFLEVQNASGSLSQGMSANIGVRVKPEFSDEGGEPPSGYDLVLRVLTPGASNFVQIPVSVKVRTAAEVAQGAIGTWTGTWAGNTLGPNNPMMAKPSSAVSGTWTVVLTAVDLAAETATGSITWNGSDAYWTYTYDVGGYSNVTPVQFIPNRTVNFSGAKSRFWLPGPQCGRFRLEIKGTHGEFNPSDAFYGPDVAMDLDLVANTVVNPGTNFTTHPYNPGNNETWTSTGTVDGAKQP